MFLVLMVGGEEINSIHLPFSHLLVLLCLQNVFPAPPTFPLPYHFPISLPLLDNGLLAICQQSQVSQITREHQK